jgi:DDE superfamily endonuclease
LASGHINLCCCASYVLSHEPDFEEQEEWLTQVVHQAGFEIIFYPKYHCELNYIEIIWGWTKAYHRRTCSYNYKDLEERLPITMSETMLLSFVRKASRFCLRFMSGYREKLEGPLLGYAMKVHRGHRVVPVCVTDQLKLKYEKYLAIKKEKLK